MIRDANRDDGLAIARVHMEARGAGYAHLLDAAYNASLTLESYAGDWQKRLAEGHRRTLVAEAEGEVRGFTRFGAASNASEPSEQAGALEFIYVLPQYWGSGLGAELLAAAEEGLAMLDYKSAFLSVYEENRRARAFYERHGWTHDGARWQIVRGTSVTQMRYVKGLRPVGPAAPQVALAGPEP